MMPPPGPIALQAVADAEANIGVHEEGGNNRGRWVEMYQASVGASPGDAWCACFCSFRLQAADAKIEPNDIPEDFPESAWTPDYKNWGVKHGLWVPRTTAETNPGLVMRGDLVLFYRVNLGRIGHIGLVRGRFPGGVRTVEGNTSDGTGVNTDGDGVYAREREWSALGAYGGFVRLPF